MSLEAALAALEAHDVVTLECALADTPDVVHEAVGPNRNHLLDMATATCDERTVAVVLAAGADVGAANVHGWTALHQAAYVGLPLLVRLLLDAGGRTDVSARGDGGTPLVVALFWGHREAAEELARDDVSPANLRVAAGLGRTALLEELLAADGALGADAGAHRGFYRPHSGFPEWTPSDDPEEVRDEGLAWAARSDALEALELLIAHGARVDADVYRGTALAWAAACGRVGAVRRLVGLGADPNARTSFGGPDHGEATTALHLAAQQGDLPCVAALLALGADPSLRDARHGSTPADWAAHGGHPAVAQRLR